MITKKNFNSIATQMIREYESSKARPPNLRGSMREIIIRSFLLPYVPSSLGIGQNAIITTSTGEQSSELDMIIYDRENYSPFKPLLSSKSLEERIFPSEVVYSVIQVEANLNQKDIHKCAEIIAKVKKLPKKAFYEETGPLEVRYNIYGEKLERFPIIGFVFAFDSKDVSNLGRYLNQINSEEKIPLKEQIDFVCVLKKGVICYATPNDKIVFPPNPKASLKGFKNDPGTNLLAFYGSLIKVVSQASSKGINFFEYIKEL